MFTQCITSTKMSLFTGNHVEKNRRCCDSIRCCTIATMDYGTDPISSSGCTHVEVSRGLFHFKLLCPSCVKGLWLIFHRGCMDFQCISLIRLQHVCSLSTVNPVKINTQRGTAPQMIIEHVLCTISTLLTLFFFFEKQYKRLEAYCLQNSKMSLKFH